MKNWVAAWKLFKLHLIIQGRTDLIVYKAYNLSESIQISSGYSDLFQFLYVHYHQLH